MKIFKYKIELTDHPSIDMPINAKILHLDDQYGDLFLWAEIDEEETVVPTSFRIYGTGHLLDEGHSSYTFIGTVLDRRGLVWHIYKK